MIMSIPLQVPIEYFPVSNLNALRHSMMEIYFNAHGRYENLIGIKRFFFSSFTLIELVFQHTEMVLLLFLTIFLAIFLSKTSVI